ncbi:MAG: hypothetical protein WD738_19800 [Pirellulales bacterium]
MTLKPLLKGCFDDVLPRGWVFLLQPLAKCDFSKTLVCLAPKPCRYVLQNYLLVRRWAS